MLIEIQGSEEFDLALSSEAHVCKKNLQLIISFWWTLVLKERIHSLLVGIIKYHLNFSTWNIQQIKFQDTSDRASSSDVNKRLKMLWWKCRAGTRHSSVVVKSVVLWQNYTILPSHEIRGKFLRIQLLLKNGREITIATLPPPSPPNPTLKE